MNTWHCIQKHFEAFCSLLCDDPNLKQISLKLPTSTCHQIPTCLTTILVLDYLGAGERNQGKEEDESLPRIHVTLISHSKIK